MTRIMTDLDDIAIEFAGSDVFEMFLFHFMDEPQRAFRSSGIQIYIAQERYWFKLPEYKDVYVCIGEVYALEGSAFTVRFAGMLRAFRLKNEDGKLVFCPEIPIQHSPQYYGRAVMGLGEKNLARIYSFWNRTDDEETCRKFDLQPEVLAAIIRLFDRGVLTFCYN